MMHASKSSRSRCTWLLKMALVCCICSPISMSTGAKANEAWDLQIKALRLSEAGKYAEADPVFKRAIQLKEAQSYRTWTYKLCLLRAVRNYVCQGHYADALPFLDKLYSM